ncbi:MAG: cyclase family protein [Deltaproteobacteria bacterium]|nr:cyclase family protein [Deltaproteobacteria bacterium]
MAKLQKLYDLTQPIYHNCPGWPEYAATIITRDFIIAKNGFNAETITLNTHTGTHIDVPYHFLNHGETIDKFPLDAFCGPAVFIDVRGKPADSPIGFNDVKPFLKEIQPGDIAILNTGWGKKRANSKEYLFEWPYLDKEGAAALLEAKVKGVGIDALSLGGWGSPAKGRPCHEVLLGAGLFIVEELLIPDEVMDGKRRWFSAFPILLNDCGGSLTRAVVYDFD